MTALGRQGNAAERWGVAVDDAASLAPAELAAVNREALNRAGTAAREGWEQASQIYKTPLKQHLTEASIGDLGAAGVGYLGAGAPGAVATLAAKKTLPAIRTAVSGVAEAAPTIARSGTIAARTSLMPLAAVLEKNPAAFGRFAETLIRAQREGTLSSTDYILQQTSPEYRKLKADLSSEEK